ncbi:hypothetical protein Belba_3608 [Belliella baltica DSM 15883]|uniref:Uncharacterized protein n=1 Tax=Belliella baltica (strain DSM 15883 / CIP 108006 / LMG 21964 / BA134) TaxID=866536 RepID=I3ZA32_BELBD|nr:hypothetical protein Belba_3608 [Belliella baltica DSM 15883]
MERLDMEKMENLVGGSDYCDTAWLLISSGGFQGDNDLYMILVNSYETHCQGNSSY